ncbi:hypothetical protein IP90_00683 [Luteimonas cucumeris]|uniref:Uncharacterized protein n=1 Tax=Luteimonas cucumeris TaxID=985012 RepID=A0A562LA84_9GAMM|nr:hypothetical protein [Luteimonas cucumeris]TWI04550.1 hypothetical protein IP90_00683 [Luteimonas cucumeris]
MAMTRTQAQNLLNQAEMSLYTDSRINGLRGLTATELARRVERTRKARDRARDLLQRQRLASRERTGSKRGASGQANQRSKAKATLLADILKRFETQLKLVQKQEKSAARTAGKRAAKKASGTAATKATRKAAASKATPAKRARKATKPASAGTATSKPAKASVKSARKAPTGGTRKRATKKITPEQALANTRKLLEAKKEQDHQAKPWQTLDPEREHVPEAGFQSPQAAAKAQELHAGESRMASIQGSISTTDRRNQGKRDSRGGKA